MKRAKQVRQVAYSRVSHARDLLNKKVQVTYVKNPIRNYVMHTAADTTKSKKVLGFEPSITLKEGIKSLVDHYNTTGRPTFS